MKPPTLFFVAQFVFWGIYGSVYFALLHVYIPWTDIVLGRALTATWTGVVCTWGLRWIYVRMYRRAYRSAVWVGLFVVCSVLMGWVWYILYLAAGELVDPFLLSYTHYLMLQWGQDTPLAHIVAYPIVLLLWSAMYAAQVQQQTLQAERIRRLQADTLAVEAQVQMLHYQLQPHFLFNALNTISALARRAPQQVGAVVRALAAFMRYTLLTPATTPVPLDKELTVMRQYLAIEQQRFQEDLDMTIEVDPLSVDWHVPPFILLPLVENAIKYGQQTSPKPLRLRLTADVSDDALRVTVANTGHWVEDVPDSRTSTKVGLQNVEQRLARYGGQGTVRHHEAEGWVYVTLLLKETEP